MCNSKGDGGLGFRHFECFNDALLTKQIWRLQKMPNSIAAQVLKARYFPRTSVLDAKVGYNPSYMWSMVRVKWVITNGSLWRVGNGSTIAVWSDTWIPMGPSLKVISNNC